MNSETKKHIPDTRILKAYARNNMNKLRTALELGVSEGTVRVRLLQIHAKTGIDPCSFYGLYKLLKQIQEERKSWEAAE